MPTPGPDPTPKRGKVLLVESDVDRRERWYDLLMRHGCAVQAVRSAPMALDALAHDWPDVILIMADTPETARAGADLAHQIRRFHEEVPIVMMGINGELPQGLAVQAQLPADAPDEVLVREIERWLSQPAALPQRLRCSVLVVDNEPKLCNVLKQFLELHNFQVTTAGSGEEALEQLARAVPMFILLDIWLPGMDGLVTLKKIKTLAAPTTVIVITGLGDDHTTKEALALGARDVITKPFSPAYLESVLLSKLYTG